MLTNEKKYNGYLFDQLTSYGRRVPGGFFTIS